MRLNCLTDGELLRECADSTEPQVQELVRRCEQNIVEAEDAVAEKNEFEHGHDAAEVELAERIEKLANVHEAICVLDDLTTDECAVGTITIRLAAVHAALVVLEGLTDVE